MPITTMKFTATNQDEWQNIKKDFGKQEYRAFVALEEAAAEKKAAAEAAAKAKAEKEAKEKEAREAAAKEAGVTEQPVGQSGGITQGDVDAFLAHRDWCMCAVCLRVTGQKMREISAAARRDVVNQDALDDAIADSLDLNYSCPGDYNDEEYYNGLYGLYGGA